MAITKKLVCFKTQANFDTNLDAGNISDYSIVFIQDTQRIWTHGVYFSNLAELTEQLSGKQDTLTAGDNISIEESEGGLVISAVDTTYTLSLNEDGNLEFSDGTDTITIDLASVYATKEEVSEAVTTINGDIDSMKDDISGLESSVGTINGTLMEILAQLEVTTSEQPYCFMARTYGDSDPTAQSFYGSQDTMTTIASHLKMAAIRGQGDYDILADCRVTRSADGKDIAVDGSDGDIMVATDCKIYLYAEKVEGTDGTLEVFGLGLVPITLFGKEAVGYDPFAMAADACVYAKLTSTNTDHVATDDARTQLHCIYNENVSGQYAAAASIFNTTYKASGAGYAAGNYSTLNEILHAQDKNEDDTTNYPYMGLYYRFVEIWQAAMRCELGTHDVSATSLLGPGATSTSVASSTTFADSAVTAGSGVKVLASDGTEVSTVDIHQGGSVYLGGTQYYLYQGMDNVQYTPSNLPALTGVRIVDKIFANGNEGYIFNADSQATVYVFDEDGNVAENVDLNTGGNMEEAKRYYTVRDCPGAKSFTDGVMTGVVNVYVKQVFADGVTWSSTDGTDLSGGTAIFKYSLPLYRGLTWSAGHWIWMQGFHHVIHTGDDGSTRYVTCLYQRDPTQIPAWNGGTYYCLEADGDTDYESGYDRDDTQLGYSAGWAKDCNPSVSLFCYPDLGGGQHTYNCSYVWRDNSYSGNQEAGYKSVNASAFGGPGDAASASAGSLSGTRSVASSLTSYAASFSLLDYQKG